MVYDEGFNMEFDDLTFFAFSKYTIDKKTTPGKIHYNSQCFSTCVGWYYNKNQDKWGCYKARRIDVDNNLEVTNKDTKNNFIGIITIKYFHEQTQTYRIWFLYIFDNNNIFCKGELFKFCATNRYNQ